MRTTIAVVAWLVAVGLTPAPARADDERSHAGQFGAHAQTGVGLRFIAPYDQEYCGQVSDDNPADPNEVCSGRSPAVLELGLSYGVSQKFEVMVDLRLGLERDFGVSPATPGPHQVAFAPGLKIYHEDSGIAKFFSSLQLSVDLTNYDQAPGNDYGLRNVNGLQLDFSPTFGAYAFVGETLAFNRWFRFELDAGIGVQARVP